MEDDEAFKTLRFAVKNFAPLYFIRSYPSDKRQVEMIFNLTLVNLTSKRPSVNTGHIYMRLHWIQC